MSSSSPIRSFVNLLAFASMAGVMLYREHLWQVRARSGVLGSSTAAGTVNGVPSGQGGGGTAAPGTPPGIVSAGTDSREAELLSRNATLQKTLLDAESRLSELTVKVQELQQAVEAAKPPPSPEVLAKQFAEQRGLAFAPPPIWKPVPLETVMEKIKARVESQLSVEAGQKRSRAAVAMGFHSDPFDYPSAAVSLAQMTNGGFYEPAENTFFYREDASLSRADGRETFISGLSAELSLQKGGRELNLFDPANDDEALARRSLMSGDANAARVRFSIADQLNLNFDRAGAPTAPPPNYSAPVYLAEIWKFSQDKGSLFVEALSGKGGNAAVDAAYARPPRSSAEILHPELLYLADPPFQPQAVDFPPPMEAGGVAPLFTNVAGELGTYVALRSWLGVDEATLASEGWKGDRYVIWPGEEGFGDHVYWKTVWRTEKDAREFFDMMRRVTMQRFAIPWRAVYDKVPDQFHVNDPRRIIRLVLNAGAQTVIFSNATDPAFAQTLQTLAASW